jgi:hypothetical protein
VPRRLRNPERFMPGDQGILNYVLNQKAAIDGLRVKGRQMMRWPRHSIVFPSSRVALSHSALGVRARVICISNRQ